MMIIIITRMVMMIIIIGERDHNFNNRNKPDYCDDRMKFMKMNVLALGKV